MSAHSHQAGRDVSPAALLGRSLCRVLVLVCAALASRQATAQTGVGSKAPPKSYAFLVACSEYDKRELNRLEFTLRDVEEFYKVLLASGFQKENIVLMHDKQSRDFLPEARKIREQLDLLLARVDSNATVIVGLSGHGVQFDGKKSNYFCPLDARLDEPDTLIALDEIYQQLESCPAHRKLLLVDACRNNPQSTLARSRAVVKLEMARPQEVQLPTGIVALFSCSSGQQSYEHPQLQQGVFFYHLVQGWKGAADNNKDLKLTLDELLYYTKEKTETFAHLELKAKQIPHFKGDFSGTWLLRELPQPPKFADPVGAWRITSAANFLGQPYGGNLSIRKDQSGLYHLAWYGPDQRVVQTGLGFVQEGRLYAAWGIDQSFGINLYKINGDGTMNAVWTHNVATATIGREVASGGTPGKLEGQYQVRGSSIAAGGGEYSGAMSINRYGDTYYIGWNAAGNEYYGIGIRHGNYLVIGWTLGEGKSYGVVDYTFEGETARGRWTMVNQTTLSHENLARVQP